MVLDVEQLRRTEFPWADTGESIYLNAASTGPLPERCVRAQDAFTRKRAAPHRLSLEEQFGVLSACRERLAALVGAEVGEIALAANTGAGINLAAWALPLGPGDVVVIPDLEFPANVYPWMAASAVRGFTLERIPARNGLLDETALLRALERPGVRVLAVSWVGFATGVVADLDLLGQACSSRGIRFVVDAIQGLGALTLDVARTPIDLLACGGQKWLLSPWGTGFTFTFTVTKDNGRPAPRIDWPVNVAPTVASRTTLAAAGLTAATSASATLSTTSGAVTTKVGVTASGLTPNAAVELQWGTVVGNRVNCTGTCWSFVSIPLGKATASASGTLASQIEVPDGLGGWHVVQMLQAGDVKAQVPFFVKRSFVGKGVSSLTLKRGQKFTIHLKGVGWTQLDNTIAVNYDNSYSAST